MFVFAGCGKNIKFGLTQVLNCVLIMSNTVIITTIKSVEL